MDDGQARPNASSKIGLVLVVLLLGALVGFLIGRASAPVRVPPPRPTPVASPVETNPCTDPGNKAIAINSGGTPSCYDAWLYTTSNDQATWTAPSGSTLVIAFKEPGIFSLQSSPTSPNQVLSGAPSSTAPHNTPYPYWVYVYGKGTPTPTPAAKTPTPAVTPQGRIIIKP
jgi:hypothetical protein